MSRLGFSHSLFLFLLATFPAIAQQPVVTGTQWVGVGRDKKELLRKINGRWWTQDNREVYPPSKSGVFWVVDSKPGVTEFYHHRPFDLRRSEQLNLWMTPDVVESLLGPPNRRFPMRSSRGGMWYYYAADGTMLDLWFMERDELGRAEYVYIDGGKQSVASIERELNGQSIFKLSAQRAGERSQQEQARRVAEMQNAPPPPLPSSSRSYTRGARPRTGSMESVEVPRAPESERPPLRRVVTKEALAPIQLGSDRQDVLSRLGEPSTRAAITGDEGVKETFTYHFEDGTAVTIRLLNGKVVKAP